MFFIASCSNFRSGKYVYIKSYADFIKVSKASNVSLSEFKRINSTYSKGEGWVFLPMSPGVLESYRELSLKGIDLLWPVPSSNIISSQFGARWGKSHEGIDIPAKAGSSILAAEAGRVIFSGNSLKSYGNMVIIKHENNFFTVYAHAQKIHVSKGDSVSRGEVIAKVGTTGRSTGPHLHFELRQNSEAINPKAYISRVP